MRRPTLATLGVLLSLTPAGAWTRAGAPLTLRPQSRLWVEGTSTVRSFQCKATALDATVAGAPDAVAAVLAGEKAVTSVEFRVPAAKMECGNGTMNEHMLKALKSKDNPLITFRVTSYAITKGDQGVRGTLAGTLTLGGQERTISVDAAGRDAADGALRVTGAHELRMSEYGLKAPTLMFGTLKVGDVVKVGFDLLLHADPAVATTK